MNRKPVFAMLGLYFAVLISPSIYAENWQVFNDTDKDFWDSDAQLAVDLDSIHEVKLAHAFKADGSPLTTPIYIATRRAKLSESGKKSLGYDEEIASEYYACGEELLATGNGTVYSAEISQGKTKVKYQGTPEENYLFAPALTGWQSNVRKIVCGSFKP